MTRRLALLLVAAAALAQTPDHVIRINVNLVQIDAIVTDGKGRPVTDLKAEDFQILQDGKPQVISNFSYVLTAPAGRPGPAVPIPGAPPVKLKPGDVRRTIALVVDDLGLSFEAAAYVRQALKKFVDEQMRPGDLVAIIRTGAGIGALQQFTADRRILYAAIDRVRYNAFGRVGIARFSPVGNAGDVAGAAGIERNSIFTAGTLGAVRYVVEGLRELPGRKTVLLFSEDLKLFRGDTERVTYAVRQLVDAANRASAVIYTIDPGGLRVHGPTAADSGDGAGIAAARSQEEFDSREGLVVLAHDTGGRFLANTNDVNSAVREIIQETEGYYLLGYHPSGETFDQNAGRPKFHRLAVRMKRPGLRVRSRSGFFGLSDRESQPAPKTPAAQIAAAMASPFGATGIELRLTPLFTQGAKGSYLNTLLFIGAGGLTFTDEPEGWHKAVIDVVAMTFGENGEAVDTSDRKYTIRLRGAAYEEGQKGLLYSVRHPVKKAGAYQMRVVVRDEGSERVGSASQFIEVPDVGKGRLTLSTIMVQQQEPDEKPTGSDTPEGRVAARDIQGSAAVRSFRQGETVLYACEVLNAKADGAQPQVESQIRLFRDGKQIFEGKPMAVTNANPTGARVLLAGGHVRLGPSTAPGDYVLQLTVTDRLAKEGRRTAAQWVDFEVRPRSQTLQK